MARYEFVFVALVVCLCSVNALKRQLLPCGALVRCSYVADPVVVTDGERCYVFRNACLLGIDQCKRTRQGLEEFQISSTEECQKICSKVLCSKTGKDVCAEFSDGSQEFTNQCELDQYVCSTGNSYVNFTEGPCPR